MRLDRPLSFLKCLPYACHDPFGRPVVLIELSQVLEEFQDIHHVLTFYMELLRLHLRELNSRSGREGQPILQYTVLVNIEGISLGSMVCTGYIDNHHILTWHRGIAVSRFDEMLYQRSITPLPRDAWSR